VYPPTHHLGIATLIMVGWQEIYFPAIAFLDDESAWVPANPPYKTVEIVRVSVKQTISPTLKQRPRDLAFGIFLHMPIKIPGVIRK
jgi:hypothetical protein